MPSSHSLDAIIEKHAVEFAEHVRAAAKNAGSEMDVQVEAALQLRFLEKAAGIKLHGTHNHTIAEGRPDSVYNRVIVEYKNPASTSDRIGDTLDAPGSKKVVEQIKNRFRDLQTELGHPIESLFGVGCDGNRFIFIRWRDKKWEVQPPVEVDQHSTERFLWALFNLGTKGKAFTPEYLAGDFGANSALAQNGIRVLYEAILAAKHPKAVTFFNQWKILFGEVCGYDVDDPSEKVKKLSGFYGLRGKPHPAELLFAVHTYYAIFMKLLAGGIVARFHGMPGDPVSRLHAARSPSKFKDELEDLEKGSVFRHFNITNFLEGDLFAWYLPEWSDDIYAFLKAMVDKLDNYNPQTLAEEPTVSRDLLKKLYQELFPKSVRHDLGEYYTPDWLAEHVLNEVGYDGDPDKRILDPACGSGTFLVLAINRIRKWYEQHRGEKGVGYEEADLCRKILTNCIGFDLNPLAVMTARTNYLIAIRGLISGLDKIEIPVYLCDSILTPSAYGGLFAGDLRVAKEIKTAAATFIIPTEIAQSRDDVTRYADTLEFCIRNGYSSKDFLARCQSEALSVNKDRLHTDLYNELVTLDKANKNGVWARIIKNSFAPLFVGRVDFVVGNPPWVNWESLPKAYREATLPIWDTYRLRDNGGGERKLGNVKRELSALFVYAATDYYLQRSGRLGFLITQTVLKSGSSAGFRRWMIDETTPLRVDHAIDMSLFLPFEGAINRTAILCLTKGFLTKYPVPYRVWLPASPRTKLSADGFDDLNEDVTVLDWVARPVEQSNPLSPWLTVPAANLPALAKVISDQDSRLYERSYAGTCTWLNGAYWVDILKTGPRTSVIRNRGDVGRSKVEVRERRIESSLLFQLLRGRDTLAWRALPAMHIVVPHQEDDFGQPIPLAKIRRDSPKAFEFFREIQAQLKKRSGYKQLLKSREEFYAIGSIGNYTRHPFKVAFKDLSEFFQCAVVFPDQTLPASDLPVIPDHTALFVNADSIDEAFYIAGMLNSVPARVALYCASMGVQTQRYFPTDVARVQGLRFDKKNPTHKRVAALSRKCHEVAREDLSSALLGPLERDLTEACGEAWSLTARQLQDLQRTYRILENFRKAPREAATEENNEGDE